MNDLTNEIAFEDWEMNDYNDECVITENKNDGRKVVNFPMSTQKCHMKDKKCDYKTLAIMTLYSNMTPVEDQHESGDYEPYRYIYKNKIIKFTNEIEDLSGKKIGTIINNMRKLSNLENGLVTVTKTQNEEIVYYITYEDSKGRCYKSISGDMLRRLVWAGNGNLIKAYLLIKYLCEDEKRLHGNNEKRITNKYICEEIGLNPNSKNNLQGITEITNTLEECDFIRKRYVKVGGESVKTHIYYSIISDEEWRRKKEERENNRYE